MKISESKVDLPNGEYDALWSAYNLSILSDEEDLLLDVPTSIGVKGINCKARVKISEGVLTLLSQ